MTAFAAVVLSIVSSVYAADYAGTFQSAMDAFLHRGDDRELSKVCAERAEAAVALGANDIEKYDALILESRCLYFYGMKAKTDALKISIFGKGKDVAERAKKFAAARAEAFYYYGINLGRWAEANGIMKSLGERHNLRRNAETAIRNTAVVDGKTIPGKEIDSYGPNRTLGRMYFKLPGMFGGDNQKSEALLHEAVEKSVERNTLNTLYLAEVLVANGKKPEARKVLDEALAFENEPAKYNENRIPETMDEMKELRALRNELGN
jgi:hypothetical protein